MTNRRFILWVEKPRYGSKTSPVAKSSFSDSSLGVIPDPWERKAALLFRLWITILKGKRRQYCDEFKTIDLKYVQSFFKIVKTNS